MSWINKNIYTSKDMDAKQLNTETIQTNNSDIKIIDVKKRIEIKNAQVDNANIQILTNNNVEDSDCSFIYLTNKKAYNLGDVYTITNIPIGIITEIKNDNYKIAIKGTIVIPKNLVGDSEIYYDPEKNILTSEFTDYYIGYTTNNTLIIK